MTHTLFLQDEEKNLLQLPAGLACKVEHEEVVYSETFAKKLARQTLFVVQDEQVKNIIHAVTNATSNTEAIQIINTLSLQSLSFHDQLEIWYTAGPTVLTTMISQLLTEILTEDDLEFVSSLTGIRHTLFGSNTSL